MKYTDDQIQQQIEAYLNQDMSDLDRSRFEKLIHDDPELHEEVELQESMMEAIRAERMLALKSGLSSVNISLWSTGLIQVAKVAALVAGIGVSGAVGYKIYTHQSELLKKQATIQEKQPVEVAQPETSLNKEEEYGVSVESQALNPAVIPFESKGSHGNAPKEPASFSNQASKESSSISYHSASPKSKVNTKQASELSSEELSGGAEIIEPTSKGVQAISTKDVVLPTDGITNKSALESVHPEVVIKRDNADRFHYQFADNKLVLYADFSNKLYEVLELNQDNTKRMFFCYDSKFYQLNPNQVEISPLKEVQDKGLIQILSSYQKRKN